MVDIEAPETVKEVLQVEYDGMEDLLRCKEKDAKMPLNQRDLR